MPGNAGGDVRGVAAQVLASVLGGQSLNAALPSSLHEVEEKDRSLLQQLCYGSLREAPRLQGLLLQLLDKPLRRKDTDVECLLLLGLYQLGSMRIPDHAAVAQTVDAIDQLKKPWARGLTNAVLRRYLREQEVLLDALDEASAASHPAWLFGKLKKQWPQQWERIVAANNAQPPMTLRINTLNTNRDDYLQQLREAGIEGTAGRLCPEAITLTQPIDVDALPGFSNGDCSVQDEAAQIAAHLLGAQPGERVLDACAAPGGKTGHILELQPALEALVAQDISTQRLEKVAENLSRLKLKATLLTADASVEPTDAAPLLFDRILVDAPCSATGVIRRHPDVKILRRPEDLVSFAQQQLQILQGVWPLLKEGGTLLYATCSVLKEENQQLIARFIEHAPDASIDPIVDPAIVNYGESLAGAIQFLPGVTSSDGLFYCRLHRA